MTFIFFGAPLLLLVAPLRSARPTHLRPRTTAKRADNCFFFFFFFFFHFFHVLSFFEDNFVISGPMCLCHFFLLQEVAVRKLARPRGPMKRRCFFLSFYFFLECVGGWVPGRHFACSGWPDGCRPSDAIVVWRRRHRIISSLRLSSSSSSSSSSSMVAFFLLSRFPRRSFCWRRFARLFSFFFGFPSNGRVRRFQCPVYYHFFSILLKDWRYTFSYGGGGKMAPGVFPLRFASVSPNILNFLLHTKMATEEKKFSKKKPPRR